MPWVIRRSTLTPRELIRKSRNICDELFEFWRGPVWNKGLIQRTTVRVVEVVSLPAVTPAILPCVQIAPLSRPEQHHPVKQRDPRISHRLQQIYIVPRRLGRLKPLPWAHWILQMQAKPRRSLGEEAQLTVYVAEGAKQHVQNAPLETLLMVVNEVVGELDLGEQRAREADVGLSVDAVLANPLGQRSA